LHTDCSAQSGAVDLESGHGRCGARATVDTEQLMSDATLHGDRMIDRHASVSRVRTPAGLCHSGLRSVCRLVLYYHYYLLAVYFALNGMQNTSIDCSNKLSHGIAW